MCSTFKLVLVGAILARVDRGEERLDRRIAYTSRDLLDNSPVTAAHQAGGALSIAALCAAAIERSDNAAANLLLRAVDGPPGVTRFARSIGDPSTRLDRSEPDLNSAVPGDARDTTTPRAMAHTMFRLAGGGALAPPSRALLRGWLESTQTGLDRLRAGFPATWRSGDKTGSGAHATSNDVAFTHPPGRAPIIVAAYLTESRLAADDRAAALAHVGRIVAAAFASTQAKPAKHA
jgi:beta-lactamase class A